MRTLLRSIVFIFCTSFAVNLFAAESSAEVVISSGSTIIVAGSHTGTITASGTIDENPTIKQETEEDKKDREKTINDINTFLIESYKLKLDRILANLNISLERVTNNDPVAQAKLLEKIRGDINTKIQVINSRSISQNRKKILSSVFSYIQENLDAKISRLVRQK